MKKLFTTLSFIPLLTFGVQQDIDFVGPPPDSLFSAFTKIQANFDDIYDNLVHDSVTLAGTPDYITISGQVLTLGQVDLLADIAGTLPVANGGTGTTSIAAFKTAFDLESGVDFDPAGTDNSTNVTLAGAYDYLTLSGQQITLGQVNVTTDITGITGTPTGSLFLRDDFSWQSIPGGGDALTTNPLSQFAATTSAQLAGVISNETGSGLLVFGTSPTLTTPNLGTPSALTLTNATGLPFSTGTTGTVAVSRGGTGRTTSTTAYGLLAAGTTPTGAQQTLAAGATTQILVGGGASALPVWTTATGSGAPVRATSPTLTTPNLGTPSALTLTNATGLPQAQVTQHQAALTITESQISDLGTYLTAETNDLSAAVTWVNVPDANVPQSAVTQHEAALSITQSQISDPGIFIEKHATSHTLTASECYGAVYYITASGVTLTLPPAADGMSITIICTTANVGIVDANASDLIILDGTALDDGDSIDSPGAAGDLVVLTYYDATGWYAASNGWTDGGES